MVIQEPGAVEGPRFDLRDAKVLCADESSQGLEIVGQILMGFNVQTVMRAPTASEFRKVLGDKAFDLVLLDSGLGGNGFSENRWLRTSRLEPNRFTPVIMPASHTPKSQIEEARDCGANFVVAIPLSSAILLQRIL
ncbi:response regulator [Brevundimonas sp.]|jgi:DNA-binding response OmpR family regulator|uniref:response regulator n=1 Tax=Brevundimonas sp. TaxID=1871086 RepID=UPI003782DDFF